MKIADPLTPLAQRLHDEATMWFQCNHGHPTNRVRCEARGVVAYILRMKYDISYPRLARILGYRQHSQAIAACRVVEQFGQPRRACVLKLLAFADDPAQPAP